MHDMLFDDGSVRQNPIGLRTVLQVGMVPQTLPDEVGRFGRVFFQMSEMQRCGRVQCGVHETRHLHPAEVRCAFYSRDETKSKFLIATGTLPGKPKRMPFTI